MRTILSLTLFLSLTFTAPGQTAPPAEEKPNPDRVKITEQYGTFQVDPLYDYAAAYAGSSNLSLKITVTTDAVTHKENLKIDRCVPEGAGSPIKIEANGSQTRVESPVLITDYYYTITIDSSAEPRQHRINLSMQYLDNEVVNRIFNLKVGVRSKGKLAVVQEEEDLEAPTFYTGEDGSYRLTLRNNFPDYPIHIKKISVESIPADLVEFTDNALVESPVTLKPSEQKKVSLRFNVKGMDFTNLISGFGDSPKLKLTVTYDDGFEREVSDFQHKLNVKIRPRDWVLISAMVVGVLVGGLIRFYLEFLARRKKITRRELLKFVLYTVIFGMVVTAFALFGKIQIIAFKASGSYDKPMAIFIIGLAGAVGGLQLFVGWYNSLKPAAEEKPRPATSRRRKREPTQDEEEK